MRGSPFLLALACSLLETPHRTAAKLLLFPYICNTYTKNKNAFRVFPVRPLMLPCS